MLGVSQPSSLAEISSRDLEGEKVQKGQRIIARFLSTVAQSLDGENGENPRFPKLLLLQSDCSIASWRTWLFYASRHDPSDPRPWLGARGTTSQPRAVSLLATRRPQVPSNISSVATRGRCHEFQLRMVAGQACTPQFHTSRGWGMVRCSEVLIFISPQTSSRLSWVKLSNTHDFQLQTPKVDTSCLHKSLDVILRLLSYLGYDEWLLQLLW
jgi:hypothetical protein